MFSIFRPFYRQILVFVRHSSHKFETMTYMFLNTYFFDNNSENQLGNESFLIGFFYCFASYPSPSDKQYINITYYRQYMLQTQLKQGVKQLLKSSIVSHIIKTSKIPAIKTRCTKTILTQNHGHGHGHHLLHTITRNVIITR